MKSLRNVSIKCVMLTFTVAVFSAVCFGQAPVISYSTPQAYTAGVAMSPLSPTNTGGAVPAQAVSTLASSLKNPNGVAFDAAGNVYVAENGANAIKRIPVGGGTPVSLGSGFKNPTGVAVDQAGNVYVADCNNNQVKKIAAGTGTITVLGSGFSSPYGLALDGAGNLYISDFFNNAVKKIAAGSNTPVIIASGFNGPTGVAVDSLGNVYVADQHNNAIKKITAGSGTVVTLTLAFGNPDGVAVDKYGNVFFSDTNQDSITELPSGGGNLAAVGFGFSSVFGVAVSAAGVVFVGDNGSVQQVTPGGYLISPVLPMGLGIDVSTGIISGTPSVASPLTKYTVTAGNASGIGMAVIHIKVILPPKPNIHYSTPQVFITGTAISPLSPTNTGGPVPPQIVSTLASGFANVNGLAVDAAGNVYLAENGTSEVKKIPVGGSTSIALGSGFRNPTGVAVDHAGNVYVADCNNNQVKKIPVDGGPVSILGSGFSAPYGIAIDGAGNLFISDFKNNQVKEIPFGSNTPVIIAGGFNGPTGVAVDSLGNVYVADQFNNAIKKIAAGSGTITTIATAFGNPDGVAVDASGNVYFSDTNRSSITELTATGGNMIPVGYGLSALYGVAVNVSCIVFAGGYSTVKQVSPGGYSVNPNLPPGLSLDPNTGIISGTPTVESAAANYTVTAVNAGGNGTALVNIKTGSTNANLSALLPAKGGLSPAFNPATLNYTSQVNNAVTSITIKPTAADTSATIMVNGVVVASGTMSAAIPLSVGANHIATVVTASDGVTTKTYMLTVTRLLLSNANLSTLIISRGVLSPAFTPLTYSYTTSVASGITSVTVTPKTKDTAATVTVNGTAVPSGTASASIALSIGANTITTVVTAQDGSTQTTYTINVTRVPSSNAFLSALTSSKGVLSPTFSHLTTTYSTTVSTTITSLTITPVTTDANATVTVNGVVVASGAASASIALSIGSTIINTVVTAQDGVTQKTYELTVNRPASSNAYLATLTLSRGVLSPSFSHTTTDYASSVSNAITSITVTPTTSVGTSTITVNGTAVTSGTASAPIALATGPNTITTEVTAQDGTTTITYTVTVTRAGGGGINTIYDAVSVERPLSELQIQNDGIIVHQGLSPNGDGINDFLLIDGIANCPDNKLQVMNRSGQLIFEAKNYDNSTKVFDGHSNKTGAMQLPGTYFYSLDYTVNGVAKHKTGFVVLKY